MPASLPATVRSEIQSLIRDVIGSEVRVGPAYPVGGGDIHHAARVEVKGGDDLFVKWNPGAAPGLFEAEADGLTALARAAGPDLRVPSVVGWSVGESGSPGWILMEHLSVDAGGGSGFGERLGRAVADLHLESARRMRTGAWGWERDNWIGSLPQSNRSHPDWATFWREERIVPQLARARARGWFGGRDGERMDRLLTRIGDALDGAAPDGPALLHGDLWGGNVLKCADGTPALFDPAVYRGDPEVDLAMSELFGFPTGFLDGYREVRPLDAAYVRVRRPLYQLYYLLVHVNLFGGGYVAGCTRAAEAVLRGV